MKKRLRIIAIPITNRLAFRAEKIFIAGCVLRNRILDYNDVDNWRKRMTILTRKGEQDDYIPVSIDNDHSFLRYNYCNDPEFSAKLQQHMDNPSHEI
jgi:hypothetical protein